MIETFLAFLTEAMSEETPLASLNAVEQAYE